MTPPRSSDGTPITPPEPSRAAAPVSRGDRIQADPGRPAELPPGIAGGEKAKARDILVGEVALAEKSTKDEAEVLLDKVLTEA